MTLEKLLIFGVALAVSAAIATSAKTVADDRSLDYPTYETEVTDLIEMIP